ncbi:TetR/AcrR family transcriptional regulator [Streptosporangium sp. NPDC048865]|uniref:TetR/AcrR family transcriptional regulator n=1 Tax=Streptosporangium sp. NPDC048865 TaxID=3155766 RepID=UPI0034422ED1
MSTPKPRAGRPPAELCPAPHERILAGALRMFADKGFDGASVAALNRELGVSHNLVHQRFGSKEKLWYATVDWAFGDVAARLLPELDDVSGGPLEQMRRIIHRFVLIHAARPEILRLVTVEGITDSPRLDYLYDHHVAPLLAAMTGPLRLLADEGVIAPVPMRTLHFLIAHGGAAPFSLPALARRIGPGDLATDRAIAEHAGMVADLVLSGLQARPARPGAPAAG